MNKSKIGDNIIKLRKKNGWSQKYFSHKLRLTQSAVSQYERGVRVPEDHIKKKMADIFGVTVDYIFF
ncbi:helix-turn-helix domain-containing protein [Bacillus cereus]|uniref:helix-turn-helix domain-containing protein n=1 Tax=Bacillus cereus TaxID=1396 RepID=UPI0015CF2D8C|nr:helix-turn-helix transcriptional regulator [Bacillus cereus]